MTYWMIARDSMLFRKTVHLSFTYFVEAYDNLGVDLVSDVPRLLHDTDKWPAPLHTSIVRSGLRQNSYELSGWYALSLTAFEFSGLPLC